MINFLTFLKKKAKKYKLKISTFGKHKKSDVRLKKIYKKGNKSKNFIKIKKSKE